MYRVEFSEHRYELFPPEEGEGPWLHQGDYGLDVTILGLYKSKIEGYNVQVLSDYDDEYGYDDIAIGDPAYIVLVEYTTGCTFGSQGDWCIPAIKSSFEEAQKAVELCYGDQPKGHYRPWDGYFQHLQNVSIKPVVVL